MEVIGYGVRRVGSLSRHPVISGYHIVRLLLLSVYIRMVLLWLVDLLMGHSMYGIYRINSNTLLYAEVIHLHIHLGLPLSNIHQIINGLLLLTVMVMWLYGILLMSSM